MKWQAWVSLVAWLAWLKIAQRSLHDILQCRYWPSFMVFPWCTSFLMVFILWNLFSTCWQLSVFRNTCCAPNQQNKHSPIMPMKLRLHQACGDCDNSCHGNVRYRWNVYTTRGVMSPWYNGCREFPWWYCWALWAGAIKMMVGAISCCAS